MAINKINKRIIVEAIKKLPASKRDIVLSDGRSLFLNLSKANIGLGSWFIILRDPLTRKQKKINLGTYNHKLNILSIDDARLKAEETRSSLNEGKIVTRVKNKNLILDNKLLTQVLVDKFINKKETELRPATLRLYNNITSHLKKSIFWDLPVEDINLNNFVQNFQYLIDEKKFAILKHIASFINVIRKWGAELNLISVCPNLNINLVVNIPKEKYRDSVLFEDLPIFFNTVKNSNSLNTFDKLYICALVLTLCRANEINSISLNDIENNEQFGNLWRIPAEKMKNKQEHLIYLHDFTYKVLLKLIATNVKMSTTMQTKTLQRLKKVFKKYNITLHGFRSTGATFLNSKFPEKNKITSMLLSHAFDQTEVDKRYNRFDFLPQKTELIIYWTEHLLNTTCIKEIVDSID